GDPGREHRLVAGDGLVEVAVAVVDLTGEPVDDPGRGGLLVGGGLFERGRGVGNPTLALIDAGKVHPAVGLAEVGHLLEDRLSLLELALLAPLVGSFEEEANAVVVPA